MVRMFLRAFAVSSLVLGTSCSFGPRHTENSRPRPVVSKVDYTAVPTLKDVAARAESFGNDTYPKICRLFGPEAAKAPQRFKIFIRPLKSKNTGETYLEARQIYLNSNYLTNAATSSDILEQLLTHEMAHLALRHSAWRWRRPNANWEEGLADYARYKVVGTAGWMCPQCNSLYPHYASGYTCTGAFLLYLEERFGANIIEQLCGAIRTKTYQDKFFKQSTGKDLEALWTEFQVTTLFTSRAAAALKLQETLGYKKGVPPKDAARRFDRLVDQNATDFVKTALKTTKAYGDSRMQMEVRLLLYLYFTQPGGTSEEFISKTQARGELPGFKQGDKGFLSGYLTEPEMQLDTFPGERTCTVGRPGDSSVYHYTVLRVSKESDWKLTRAWRSAAGGTLIEEFPVSGVDTRAAK
jgi:hypothetical protein